MKTEELITREASPPNWTQQTLIMFQQVKNEELITREASPSNWTQQTLIMFQQLWVCLVGVKIRWKFP